jgi:Tfp pilus assembly protein PilN
MTALLTKSPNEAAWQGMPGWGVVADLTPPELVTARRIKALRKIIAFALVGVALLCAGGYVDAVMKHSSAAGALASAQDESTALSAEQGKYVRVTQVQAATDAIISQVQTLTQGSVDVAQVLHRMRDALPGSMSLTSVNVAITNPTGLTPQTTPTLNSTGHIVIGSVTLTGSARTMVDLAAYVDALSKLRGVVDVIPTQNNNGQDGAAGTWNVTAQLTDALAPSIATTTTDSSATTTTDSSATTTTDSSATSEGS